MEHTRHPEYSGPARCRAVSTVLLGCLLAIACMQARAEPATYTFGVVPLFEQRQLFAVWKPVLDDLEYRTGLQFQMGSTPTIPSFEQQFMTGRYDFAYMNPYHALMAVQTGTYLPLVRDELPLRGVLLVRKDSPFYGVEQLHGHVIAFPAPNALGAALLMRHDLERKFALAYTPLYVQTHTSVHLHILQGLVSAGGGVDKALQAQSSEIRDGLRSIYSTDALPSHPVVAHRRVPEAHRERVQQALLEMGRSDAGRRLLQGIPMTVPVTATENDYLPLQKLELNLLEPGHGKAP